MNDNYWNHDNLPEFDQMVLTSKGEEVSFITVYEDQVCLHSENHGLIIRTLNSIKPIPSPKQVARDKAIAEMVDIVKVRGNGTTVEMLYDAGYRKVKPLPIDVYDSFFGDCMPLLNEWLIENGYCIGEDE